MRQKTGMSAWPSRRGSFTLIEVLVVLTVISVLAALLSPAISAAKEKAHRVKCASNLRQIGIAQHVYANDHNGWFWDPGIDYSSMGGGWPFISPEYFDRGTFSNYVKITDVLYCPSRLRRPHKANNPLSCQLIKNWGLLHTSLRHYCPMRGLSVMHDSRYILLYERTQYFNFGYSWQAVAGDDIELWPWGINEDSNHGGEGSNILYVDGRVEWKKGNPGPFYASSIAPPGAWEGTYFYSLD